MRVHRWFIIATVLLGTVTGCSTPGQRAVERSAAFHRLASADQSLVLHGEIRVGMDKDAVYIAWGAPDERVDGGKGQEAAGQWFYERRLTITEPFGATDQFGPYHGLAYSPGPPGLQTTFGFRGIADQGYFLYQPHVRLIDVRYRRAEFSGEKLVRFVDKRDGNLTLSAEADAALRQAADAPAKKVVSTPSARSVAGHHHVRHGKRRHHRRKVRRAPDRHVDQPKAAR